MSTQVVAVITSQPGSEAAVRQALKALVPPTRAEAGCLSYDLSESTSAPGTFVTVESWSDPSDLDAHMATDHVQTAFAAVGSLLAGPPAIHPLAPVEVG